MFKARVGITLRVLKHPKYNEVMTCLDQEWYTLLTSIGILPVPLPLLQPDLVAPALEQLGLDGVILSGGNTIADVAGHTDNPETLSPARDAFETSLVDYVISYQVPVLGVCRGLQVLNHYFGGKLKRISGHAGRELHPLIAEPTHYPFGCPTEVNSFHDWAIPADGLGQKLLPLACDKDGNIEAFHHVSDPILAIMWHPERGTRPRQSDLELIKRHFLND